MPAPTTPIHEVQAVLDALEDAVLGDGPLSSADIPLADLAGRSELLGMPRYAGHAPHLAGLRQAVLAGDRHAARRHVLRLRGSLRPAANDRPFRVGDPVSVTRSRHGWHDGTPGTVTDRSVDAGGTWSYDVTGEDGEEFEVGHTRDLHPRRR